MLDDKFLKTVQKIAKEYGNDVFLDKKKFKSLLKDLNKGEFKTETTLLLLIIDADCVKYINMTEDTSACKQFLVKHLDDAYSLSASKTSLMLDLLFFVLRGNVFENSSKTDSATIDSIDDEFNQYLCKAITHHSNGDFEQAIVCFTQAIQIDPNHAGAYTHRGFEHLKKRNFVEAVTDFNHAIQIDPKYVQAFVGRGLVYQAKKSIEQAIENFTQAIQINPNCELAYIGRGIECFIKKDYKQAIIDYTHVIQFCSNDAIKQIAFTGRGLANRSSDQAITDFTQAIQLGVNDIVNQVAGSGRGRVYRHKRDFQQVKADFNWLVDPFRSIIMYNIQFDVYQILNKHLTEEFMKLIQTMRLDPKGVEIYLGRGLENKEY